ncbi:hypothetical protein BDN71DRAFT_232149 [Pleurotus eryngii]|uniref:Uncharacterized protein n=1 Tax=Pleurotus eryngii TaxID=5323 RepID=A0A9P5ZKP6_PLEER|nr:hypothetical protein BDN71DRAFT_232149 [Pleurotus eryngii]
MLVTEKEADEIASRAEYDERDEAHIAVTSTLSVGTGTIWFKVEWLQLYPSVGLDVGFVVEFGNSEECTRFLREHMRKLECRCRFPPYAGAGIAVIDDIMRALDPIRDDLFTTERNAGQRGIPFLQFVDDLPQPETQLIRHRCSNRGDDRPCYLTLHITTSIDAISNVDWSATTIPPTFPSHSSAFRSLNDLHLKFPSPASQDCNPNSSSQSHQDDLTITISAGEISFSTGANPVSLGNRFTLSSVHRTVNVNYINAIMGDAFLGTINGGNNGGRNNVNTIRISNPVGSRSPRLARPLPRRPTPLLQHQAESQAGVGRWVQPHPSRSGPY